MGGTSLDQQTGWLVESCKISCDFNRNTVSTDQIKVRFLTGVSKVSKTGKDNINPGLFTKPKQLLNWGCHLSIRLPTTTTIWGVPH